MTPSEAEERITYHDFIELLAHYGLQDPNKKLERELEFQDAVADIRIDRAERAIVELAEKFGEDRDALCRRLTFDEFLRLIREHCDNERRWPIDNDEEHFRAHHADVMRQVIQRSTPPPP